MIEPELRDDIAIIGMAGRFPGARNLKEFWDNLVNRRETITFFSEEELRAEGVDEDDLRDPNYVRASPILDDMEMFDAPFFGFTPKEADIRDPQHRVFLEAAYEAFQHAGYDPRRFDGAVGVYGGVFTNRYAWLNVRKNIPVMMSVGGIAMEIANHADYVATLVAYKLNLRGPALTVATACSTSMVALHLACQSLRNGECDMALAGAVEIELPHRAGYTYAEGGIFSPDGHCRAFDAKAQGTIFGSGTGVVLIKRLENAIADGDCIHAVIKGSAINNDGSQKVGFTAPSVEGQKRVVAEAYGVAGIDPTTVSYVEAHGTGTALGDPIEVSGLSEVFAAGTDRKQWCAIGSVKTNIGHLGPAAGVAGLIKTVLALEHGAIPPSLHFEKPNPKIDFESSPFYVATELLPWPPGPEPRRAGLSSFGIGGTNAHVILEEAPAAPASGPSRPWQLLLLSARTDTALEASTANLLSHLHADPDTSLADVAFTLQVGREGLRQRRSVVCRDVQEAITALEKPGSRAVTIGAQEARPRPVAFMFPGQGTQHPGMGRELYESEPAFREAVDRCCELLRPELGLDLRTLLYPSPEEREWAADQLAQTRLTQPVLFVVEYGLALLWMEWGIRPAAMIGHSVGEYAAACLAGVFSLEEALALVAARGRLMQEMPAGSMLAVPLPEEALLPMLDGSLELAAANAPGLCAVSGPNDAIDSLAAELGRRGVETTRLRTSHAFHSAMMEPILQPFADRVAKALPHAPAIPFVSNLTGTWITDQQATDPNYWSMHLRRGVRFSDGVAQLLKDDRFILLEVGPGQVLSSLARMQPASGPARLVLPSMRPPQKEDSDLAVMFGALGRLWIAGQPVDWKGFYARERRRRLPLPTYPFERKRHWVDPIEKPEVISSDATAAPASADGTGRLPIEDWFSVPVWKQSAPTTPRARAERSTWLVFVDDTHLGKALARRLHARGDSVVTVSPGRRFRMVRDGVFTIRPEEKADYVALLEALAAGGVRPRTIVHMWNVGAPSSEGWDLEHCRRDEELGYHSLCHLAQALARHPGSEQLQLHVVTTGMADPLNDRPASPAKAAVLGVVLVLPKEATTTTCQAIDIISPSSIAEKEQVLDQLLAEIDTADPDEPLVAYRGRRRWVRSFSVIRLDGSPESFPLFPEKGVCLMTGGLGAVALTIGERLAQEAQARLVLVGRSAFPDRAEWPGLLAAPGTPERLAWQIRKLQSIEAQGGTVMTASADVTDREQMRRVVAEAKARFGAINGVVHAAGIAGGGMLALKTREAASAVLAPKIEGAAVLAELLGGEQLSFFLFCSSLISVSGDFGQADYCAANNVLDAFAAGLAARGVPAISINYPGWLEVGMAAQSMDAPAAFRDLQRGVRSHPSDHPLLDRRLLDGSSDMTFSTVFTPTSAWMLDEHRMEGDGVVPGVGYLELARAAYAEAAGSGPVELKDIVFLAPLRVHERRELRILIKPGQESADFSVVAGSEPAGRENDTWSEFARGSIRHVDPGPAPVHDLEAIRRRCSGEASANTYGSEHNLVVTGPRWRCLDKVMLGDREELALVQLPAEFAGDLGEFGLHPSLLDCATTFAQTRVPDDYFLPFGYGRVVVRAPLPERFYTHIKQPAEDAGDFVSRDIVLMDEEGTELVAIDSFTLRRVSRASVTASLIGGPSAPSTEPPSPNGSGGAEHVMSKRGTLEMRFGVRPEDAVESLRRILAAGIGPQVVVCVEGVEAKMRRTLAVNSAAILEELAAAPLATPVQTERNVGTPYSAPETDLQSALCAIWQDGLGVTQIGLDDDFFELGGNSLVAVQVASRVRDKFKIQLPLQTLFESPTVRLLAEAVEAVLLDKVGAMSEQEAAAMLASAPS